MSKIRWVFSHPKSNLMLPQGLLSFTPPPHHPIPALTRSIWTPCIRATLRSGLEPLPPLAIYLWFPAQMCLCTGPELPLFTAFRTNTLIMTSSFRINKAPYCIKTLLNNGSIFTAQISLKDLVKKLISCFALICKWMFKPVHQRKWIWKCFIHIWCRIVEGTSSVTNATVCLGMFVRHVGYSSSWLVWCDTVPLCHNVYTETGRRWGCRLAYIVTRDCLHVSLFPLTGCS